MLLPLHNYFAVLLAHHPDAHELPVFLLSYLTQLQMLTTDYAWNTSPIPHPVFQPPQSRPVTIPHGATQISTFFALTSCNVLIEDAAAATLYLFRSSPYRPRHAKILPRISAGRVTPRQTRYLVRAHLWTNPETSQSQRPSTRCSADRSVAPLPASVKAPTVAAHPSPTTPILLPDFTSPEQSLLSPFSLLPHAELFRPRAPPPHRPNTDTRANTTPHDAPADPTVSTGLNEDAWTYYLRDYPDRNFVSSIIIIYIIRHGANLGFTGDKTTSQSCKNLGSAFDSSATTATLAADISAQVSNGCTAERSTKIHRIRHLSWPRGHSVNNAIIDSEAFINYKMVDRAISDLMGSGPGSLLVKFDLEVFRPAPQLDYLGFNLDTIAMKRTHCRLHKPQELTGFLQFSSQVVPTSRTFLRSLYDFSTSLNPLSLAAVFPNLPAMTLNGGTVSLPSGMVFGSSHFLAIPGFTSTLMPAASKASADGSHFGSDWFSARCPRRYRHEHIQVREMLAVVHAILCWGDAFTGKHVIFHII
ncbi:hypothetical protein DFH08DRAFT_1016294 [Mycena albidolilacea]|uniref:Uncharacterized protein n=1 Tax=Mycena albidolilacea TaxID=1033008 RepID=A0AAD7ANX0_9AGAR|nr:hypothetical protein DFH08DRAFT_1016294 [Mycena albidolilacea]